MRFAVFALGSSAYPNFCAFGKYVDNLLGELGGERLLKLSQGDEMCGQEQAFRKWAPDVFSVACETFCLDDDDTFLEATLALRSPTLSSTTVRFVEAKEENLAKALSKCHNRNVTACRLNRKTNLHGSDASRATMLLELACDLPYTPGDHVGVFACNRQELVDGILSRLQTTTDPDQPVELQMQKENHTSNGIVKTWEPHERLPPCSLRTLFSRFLDITTPPTPNLLQHFASLATDQEDQRRLTLLASIYDVSIICQPDRSHLVPVAWQQWSEMEALIPSPAACEVRSVIKFFNAKSIAPIEIHRQLCQVYGPNIMSKQMVRRWCRQFSEGRQSVHDEECSGRRSLINDDRVELVRQCIMENRRFTTTELSSHFPQISRSLLHEIVTKHLLFKKVCPRWVPKNLTPEHKMQRLGAILTFLQRYHDDGDEFLDRIVTGNETWISHFTPETKQQSMHWRHSGSPVRTKFKQTLSVRKVMCTVFWDRKGILLIDFLPRGETVNADRYCETLRKLRRAIQNKRRGMLTAGVVLLHDNARPHKARRTASVLTEFGWELFDYPPYSPDLAPSDFHVFLHLKKFLSSGERFGNDEELKTSVTRWFHSQAAEFYDRGIQKLIPRYDKCLNSDGGYESAAYEDWRHWRIPHLLEVLEEFPSVRPSAALLAAQLTPLQPRFYSISSSPVVQTGEIHITVAVVSYRTQDGEGPVHFGVCSNYLRDAEEESDIHLFVRSAPSFYLPQDVSRPVIMVGPGTGIAPFRGFWQHRRAQLRGGTDREFGKMWLFFGCRQHALDLYREEKADMLEEGVLDQVYLALSREPTIPKTYVQDLIRKEAAAVYQKVVVEGGHFYVCGDCTMAEHVYQMLKLIIQEHGGMLDSEVESYMLTLRDENRYHEDIFGITLRTAEVHNRSRESARIRMASQP
ncbi:hypothetical protein ANN_13795 [Periplaneta americana]|uniref:nitric-oxide synthase (NADPH) n=1 Tax=Periplaneta americana TaxID=6978 RepID=A0ABQ8SVQ8_PERAM|nr:hypothetical protein ANN_13795 [Periplaneta americana]